MDFTRGRIYLGPLIEIIDRGPIGYIMSCHNLNWKGFEAYETQIRLDSMSKNLQAERRIIAFSITENFPRKISKLDIHVISIEVNQPFEIFRSMSSPPHYIPSYQAINLDAIIYPEELTKEEKLICDVRNIKYGGEKDID